MSTEAEAIALAFFAAWAERDLDAIMRHIAPGCRFVNGAVGVTEGAEAMRALFGAYVETCSGFEFRVLAAATCADGRTVLNERLDFLFYGAQRLEIQVAGAVVVEHGAIQEIRDHFDFEAVQRQRAGWTSIEAE